MAEKDLEEKSEKATPKKREDALKKGQVAKSRELPSVAVLMAALAALSLFGTYAYNHIRVMMRTSFSQLTTHSVSLPELIGFAQQILLLSFQVLAPLLLAIFLAAVFSNVLQFGFVLSAESIKPKLSKLDPIKGFGRLLSKQSLMELMKSLLKLFIVGGIAYFTIKGEMKNAIQLGDMSLNDILTYMLYTTFKIFLKCTLAMVLLVVIDYAFQRHDFEKKLKMSKKEVKDEFKRSEGDPQVKLRIKSIQMEMARKRMMQDVPEADVVVTNPTRLAVALKWDDEAMDAPKLLAKGAGKVAERIRELATQNGIPLVENKEIAQTIYKLVDIGQEIPTMLYQAVAEILAHVYRLRGADTAYTGR